MDYIIETKALKRTYSMGEVEVKALRGVDLKIKKGEFLVILGPSGSGKTTLLNILGGIDTPTGGSVRVQGKDISKFKETQLSDYRRSVVGWVFQFFNLIPSLTTAENVALALELAHETKDMMKKANDTLKLVGIPEKENMFPSQLSGGQQQRVAIARALIKKPKIVLADEPTGNLDQITSETIANLMRDVNQKEGVTFVVVSHEKSITRVADRVIHLHDGKIIKEEKGGK
jgi:putative ABC transport system ATP-binding protein